METAGSICFGLVIGWITYRTLRRREGNVALTDIATVLGVVGGASVTALFDKGEIFGGYCVGLAIGFFLYLIVSLILDKMGEKVESTKNQNATPTPTNVGDWMRKTQL